MDEKARMILFAAGCIAAAITVWLIGSILGCLAGGGH